MWPCLWLKPYSYLVCAHACDLTWPCEKPSLTWFAASGPMLFLIMWFLRETFYTMPVDFINASKSYDLCVWYGMYYIAEGEKMPEHFLDVCIGERTQSSAFSRIYKGLVLKRYVFYCEHAQVHANIYAHCTHTQTRQSWITDAR